MYSLVVQFVLSASAVVISGILLTKFADSIAEQTKLSKAIVGSIILAGGTSLPELLVDVNAIKAEMPDLAVGDLLGSSLFNLLILSLADLLHSNPRRLLARTDIVHSISASLTILVTGIAAISLFTRNFGGDISLLGIGLGPMVIVIAYVFGLRLISRNQDLSAPIFDTGHEPKNIGSLNKSIIGYIFSAGIIFVASPFLAESAGEIAEVSGLGKTFIGTILVAFCTSLPEFVSTLTAVRMGANDLALGNIFGSNAFNMLLFIPLDFFHPGLLLSDVSQVHTFSALAVMVITSIFILGQLNQIEKERKRFELDAICNIVLIFIYFGLLYFLRGENFET